MPKSTTKKPDVAEKVADESNVKRIKPEDVPVDEMAQGSPPEVKKQAALYMRNDENLPVSYSIVSPTGKVSTQGIGSGETLTKPVFYRFERGKNTPVHPDDFEVLQGYKHRKNGQFFLFFGEPSGDAGKAKTTNEELAELKAQMAELRGLAQGQGIIPVATSDTPASKLSNKHCQHCENIVPSESVHCNACGKTL